MDIYQEVSIKFHRSPVQLLQQQILDTSCTKSQRIASR